jgi:ketosteroid isomerase-like protein
MSTENVEVVRATLAAWNAGDMDAVGEFLDSDIVVRMPEDWFEPIAIGREAVLRGWGEAREIWAEDILQPTSDFIDVGNRVALRFIWRGEGRVPDSQMEFTAVYTVRNGKISNQESFWDHAEALEALGLVEQNARAESP